VNIFKIQVSFLLFKFLLDFDSILVCCKKQGDAHELCLYLDVYVQMTIVLEHQIPLKFLNTQLGVKGMNDICEL